MTKATKSRSCVAWWNYSATAERRRWSKIAHKVCLTLTHWPRNLDGALQSRMEFAWKTGSVLIFEKKDTM